MYKGLLVYNVYLLHVYNVYLLHEILVYPLVYVYLLHEILVYPPKMYLPTLIIVTVGPLPSHRE